MYKFSIVLFLAILPRSRKYWPKSSKIFNYDSTRKNSRTDDRSSYTQAFLDKQKKKPRADKEWKEDKRKYERILAA